MCGIQNPTRFCIEPKKWKGRHVANWAMVRNQLLMDDRMSQLMQQYDVAY